MRTTFSILLNQKKRESRYSSINLERAKKGAKKHEVSRVPRTLLPKRDRKSKKKEDERARAALRIQLNISKGRQAANNTSLKLQNT